MHKRYARDKLIIIQALTKDEALKMEEENIGDSGVVVPIDKKDDESILALIRRSSQNSICFYPAKLYYDEAIKRGLDIKEIVSQLPLLKEGVLYVPKGVKMPSAGKYFDEVLLSPNDKYWYKFHWINQDKKLKLRRGFCSKEEMVEVPDLSSVSDDVIEEFLVKSSQNSLSFYPNRCYLEEGLKRGFVIEDLISKLPLLSDAELWIPQGVELWSDGSIYREI